VEGDIMRNVKIMPVQLNGNIAIPPSKSLSHRALIAAGLSCEKSTIRSVMHSEDIDATCEVIKNLNVNIEIENNAANITPHGKLTLLKDIIDCRESGSTLRFFIPIILTLGKKVVFQGKGRLVDRPLDTYYDLFNSQGINYENTDGKLPLIVDGILKPGIFNIRGDISSQFITGLLFALPMLEGDSIVNITSNLESKGYVDLTLDVLTKFSIEVENHDYKSLNIKGNQRYKALDYTVEGDYSQAAFWLAAGVLGGHISCENLDIDSLQGDKVIIDTIKAMGGNITDFQNKIIASKSELKGIEIDAAQCPDLIPILTVLGALSNGTTTIYNAYRARLKESDRLSAITEELAKLGAEIEELNDKLIIKGKAKLKGGVVVNGWNDHRIVMALTIAALGCTEPVMIEGSDCITKSYPHFFQDFSKLGGQVQEWDLN
jgi:3-phosphoshikimate 1-carboxyvinyltransferase